MVDATPPSANDGTLKLSTHLGAVAAGAITGFITTRFDVTLDATEQATIALFVSTVVTTLWHWMQAQISKSKAVDQGEH